MFYKTQNTFRDFIIDSSKNEFFPKMTTIIDGVTFGYDFQTEVFFSDKKENFEERQKIFEHRFKQVFLMDIPKYTEHLKKTEELYELNIEQMEELLFRVWY